MKNCDELFTYPELSAAPDSRWPDIFSSGVFVMQPNYSTYDKLVEMALKSGSFEGLNFRIIFLKAKFDKMKN